MITKKETVISGDKVILRDKNISDARNDYIWHTDAELSYLDANPIPDVTFQQFLMEYTFLLNYQLSARCQFAIDTREGKHIGNCMCYDIDKYRREAEFGIMIGNRNYWDKNYGFDATNTMLGYMFRTKKLRRIYLKTLTSNIRGQKCFQKCGFRPYGSLEKNGFSFLLMELFRNDWAEMNSTNNKNVNGGGDNNNSGN